MNKKIIYLTLAVAVFMGVVFYKSSPILAEQNISAPTLISPETGTSVTEPFIHVVGEANVQSKVVFYIDGKQNSVHGDDFIRADAGGNFDIYLPVQGEAGETITLEVMTINTLGQSSDAAEREVVLASDFQFKKYQATLKLIEKLADKQEGRYQVIPYIVGPEGGLWQANGVNMQDFHFKSGRSYTKDFHLQLFTNTTYVLMVKHLHKIVGFTQIHTGDIGNNDVITIQASSRAGYTIES